METAISMSTKLRRFHDAEFSDGFDENENLLNTDGAESERNLGPHRVARCGSWLLHRALFIILSLALVICNISLYAKNCQLKLAVTDRGFSLYERGMLWRQFHTYTPYSNVNRSISDALWDSFTTNGFIAIPHSEAAEFGLPVAEDFPDDPSKGVYVLEGFHDLHCVIYLRETINRLMAGESVSDRLVHIHHCYDALRQSIQCKADDTPLYIPYRSRLTGNGQVRRCRDWAALTAWAEQHSACWPTGHCADLL